MESLVIRCPDDLVCAIPYLLGFHPVSSIVAVGSGGPHGLAALRFDLPEPGEADMVQRIACGMGNALADNGFVKALLVGYGPGPRVTLSAEGLTSRGVRALEMLRVQDGCWWSYMGDDRGGNCPDGVPYDIASSISAAYATVAGMTALSDREQLRRSVAPTPSPARSSMRVAPNQARKGLRAKAASLPDTESAAERARTAMVVEGIRLIEKLYVRLGRHAGDEGVPPVSLTDDEVAWLSQAVRDLRVRDEALLRVNEDHLRAYVWLWQDVLRRVEPVYAAAPGCLLAYFAYANGNGPLANVALDRAQAAEPDYPLALLLRRLIQAAIPPSQLRLCFGAGVGAC